jgi:hypothetical protein
MACKWSGVQVPDPPLCRLLTFSCHQFDRPGNARADSWYRRPAVVRSHKESRGTRSLGPGASFSWGRFKSLGDREGSTQVLERMLVAWDWLCETMMCDSLHDVLTRSPTIRRDRQGSIEGQVRLPVGIAGAIVYARYCLRERASQRACGAIKRVKLRFMMLSPLHTTVLADLLSLVQPDAGRAICPRGRPHARHPTT